MMGRGDGERLFVKGGGVPAWMGVRSHGAS